MFKKDKLAACSFVKKKPVASQSSTFYKNTQSFYSSVAINVNLGITLEAGFTLGFTLDYVSKRISDVNRTVAGNMLEIVASTYQSTLYEDCLMSEENLEPSFLFEFAQLPTQIDRPWWPTEWVKYEAFLKRYGSHMVSSIIYGASIKQMAFAESKNEYTERDFHINCCLQLGGSMETVTIDFNICAGITKEEIKRVKHMSMSDSLVIRGGSDETRNALIGKRTAELIKQFMSEAKKTNSTIEFKFTSIWDIMKGASMMTSDNYLRAVNLENFYLGYKNYGCKFQMSGNQILQVFNHSRFSTPEMPVYECSLGPDGCHSDHDCHYAIGVFCACRGRTCIEYKEIMLDTGAFKTVAVPHLTDTAFKLEWKGCDWKPALIGSSCQCRKENHQRKVVWSSFQKSGYRVRDWERFPRRKNRLSINQI